MKRSGNMRTSNFVQAATSREGCDWAVYVDLATRPPSAVARRMGDAPRSAIEIARARRSCEAVARRIAAEMNAARKS